MSDEEETAVIVCTLMSAGPDAIHTDGDIRYCNMCGEAVWLSDSSLAVFDYHTEVAIWCTTCTAEHSDEVSDIHDILPEQYAELEEAGVDIEFARQLLRIINEGPLRGEPDNE